MGHTGIVARRGRGILAACIAVLPLFGCSFVSNKFSDVKCPSTDVTGELGTITRVRGTGGNYADLEYHGSLNHLTGSCDVDDDGVTVSLSVTILAEIGPAATDPNVDLPYFVAVVGPDNRVVAKRVLDDKLTFAPQQSHAGAVDHLTQRIDLKNKRDAPNYHVFLGFQLTKDELDYNRAHGGS
jgi:hypothetical protein